MVNRFSQPTEVEYISLYTPIPFEQLFRLGKEYNDRVDKANQAMHDSIMKWALFKSPSEKDMQTFNDLTVNPARKLVDKYVENPDLLKTLAGRSELYGFINGRDYGTLSELELSADAMRKRQALEQQLSLAGKYNPLWHGMDYTNYDTANVGIFNDLNLTPYKSEVDLVKPYVDNLKPSYLYTKGMYDYSGVSGDTTDKMVERNLSAIYNTPEAQMHIKSLIKQGFTPSKAKEEFEKSIYRAGREFAYETREANAFNLKGYTGRGSGRDYEDNGPFYLTQSIEATGLQQYLLGKSNMLANTQEYAKAFEQSKSTDESVKQKGEEQLKKLTNLTPSQVFRKVIDRHGSYRDKGDVFLTHHDMNKGINEIINNFSIPVSAGPLQTLLSSTINGISEDAQSTPLGKRKVITGGENMNLTNRVISGIAGYNYHESDKVYNHLKAGDFTNMILLSNGNVISIPVISNDGRVTTQNMQEVKVAISDDEIKRLGLTEDDMVKAGGTQITTQGSSTDTVTLSGDYDNEENENKFEKVSQSSSKKPSKVYWEISLQNEIPINGVGAEYLNQAALKQNIGSTGYTPEYTNVQNQAFGFK